MCLLDVISGPVWNYFYHFPHFCLLHGRAVNYVDSDWSIEILGFIIEILEIDVWEKIFLPNCWNFETFLFFKFLHINSPKKVLLRNKWLKILWPFGFSWDHNINWGEATALPWFTLPFWEVTVTDSCSIYIEYFFLKKLSTRLGLLSTSQSELLNQL